MLKKLIASSLLASSLIMTGCQTTPPPSDTIEMANIQQLQQRTWILTQIGNTEIFQAFSFQLITASVVQMAVTALWAVIPSDAIRSP